ncbi:winged helix-turn-helix domain-containing protein [Serratia aquatilis]|uniref:Transcriptional regulator n=1 Tax=Serratia aquatilis TaxID=1737515 RepID=A0ABV6EB23_9GAMM
MNEKFLINDSVLYSPDEHRLTPLGSRGRETVLNAPVNRCLLLLLKNPGVVVSQEEIFREVWEKQGQYVTMNTLYQNILLLRRAMLNAGVIKKTIKTIPKVGFVFTGNVQVLESEREDIAQSVVNVEFTDTSFAIDAIEHEQENNTKDAEGYNTALPNSNSTTKIANKWPLINSVKWKTITRLLSPAAFLGILFILLTIGPAKNILFFNTHDKWATVNQCSIYIDRGERASYSENEINFLKARNVTCGPDEFIYITKTPTNDNILVLFCDTASAGDGDMRCSTRFNMASNTLEPMANKG